MNKTSKIILAVVVVMAIAVALVTLLASSKDQQSSSESTTKTSETPAAEEDVATVTYSNDGFSPASVTVNAGDKITFTNNSDAVAEPSSGPHPVHTDNPELNVGDLQPGESATIVVATKGTWGMHNHYTPSHKITVIVN